MRHKRTFFWILLIFLYSFSITLAVPPTTKYQPGATLDPSCAPSDTNCSVQILPDQTSNANKYLTTDGSSTAWSSSTLVLGGNFVTSGAYATTLTTTGTTTLTLPTSGTLATTANINTAVSGTLNYIPKFTGTNTIGNSLIFDDGTNVGIGTSTPSSKLQVSGDIQITSGSGGQIIFADGSTMASSGLGSAAALSAAADAIVTGDSDANGTGDIILKTGSNDRLHILNSGNVGINTATPSALFSVGATSPFQVTNLGAVTALSYTGAGTGLTGTAPSLTAGNVTTNANLTGHITSIGNETSLGVFTSSNLSTALTDETGTGLAVFATSPTLTTPNIGVATGTSLNLSSGAIISGLINGQTISSSANFTGTGTFSGSITSNISGANFRGISTSGVSQSAYALFQGTDASSVDKQGYVGINVFGTDGSLELVNAAGAGLKISQTAGAATFAGSVAGGAASFTANGDVISMESVTSPILNGFSFAVRTILDGDFSIIDKTNSATRLHINPTGNIGIGTTTPQRLVHILGATAPQLRISGTADTIGFDIGYNQSGHTEAYLYNRYAGGPASAIKIGFGVPGAGEVMTLFQSGDVVLSGSGSFGGGSNVTTGTIRIPNGGSLYSRFSDDSANRHVISYGSHIANTISIAADSTPVNIVGAVSIANLISCGGIQTNGSGTMSCTSDERLKDIEGEFTEGLEAIRAINPIAFSWKTNSGLYDDGVVYYGFSAQNVQGALPEAISLSSGNKLQVSQLTLMAAAINAIKELDIKVQALPEFDDDGSIAIKVADFLRGIAERGEAMVERVKTESIQTDTLCVGAVCVSEDAFLQMVENAGSYNNTTNNTPDPNPTPEPTPDEEPSVDEQVPDLDPNPDPVLQGEDGPPAEDPAPQTEPEPQPTPEVPVGDAEPPATEPEPAPAG